MKKTITTLLCAALATTSLMAEDVAGTSFGFANGTVSRQNVFRQGSSRFQGMAMRLPKEKIQLFKGCSITGLSVAFGTSNTTDKKATIFLTKVLDGTSLAEKEITITRAATWSDFAFDTPYVIQGDEEELYLGFTADLAVSGTVLMSDGKDDLPGRSYVVNGSSWMDIYGQGRGQALVRVIIDGAPEITDLVMKPVALNGYFNAGKNYTLNGQVHNFGSAAVNSFDLVIEGDLNGSQTMSFKDLDIAPGKVYDFEVPDFSSKYEGLRNISYTVQNVNGGKDADSSDNNFTADYYFYPPVVERALLLEGFTGQACGQCPAGHRIISGFLEGDIDTEIIEVMHHSGYYADYYTMKMDDDLTRLYNSNSTYAPAIMMNRQVVPEIGECPVTTVSVDHLNTFYDYCTSQEPFVTMTLNSSYDPATGKVGVDVEWYNHRDLPNATNVVNVMLVQDGIVSFQSGYSEYTHEMVCRGALTGNAWGLTLSGNDIKGDNYGKWSTEYTLPATILSDHWAGSSYEKKSEYNIATDPENTYLVAYVGGYSSEMTGNEIYNCVKVKLGDSYSQQGIPAGVESVKETAPQFAVAVEGNSITVLGDYDSAAAYDLNGRHVGMANLAPGLYIVTVVKDGRRAAKKVLVK